jgi:NTP pyrophosphatase (non-canonical NTP hydrolase)
MAKKHNKKQKKKQLSSKEQAAMSLSLHELRRANVSRCEKHFHKLNSWSSTDWACALAGEVGELCNFIKKMKRGEDIPIKKLAKECGDILCYLDLLSASLNIDLAEATIDKFNEVSKRKKSDIRL